MADLDLEDVLQTALDAVRGKKTQAKLDDVLARKFSLADLKAAYAEASDEDKAEFREMFGGSPAQVLPKDTAPSEPKPRPKPRAVPSPPPEPKPTRAGRKAGSAYDWDVDENGQVFALSMARVYNGPSEPDEVEIPDAPEPKPEPAADDAADVDDAA